MRRVRAHCGLVTIALPMLSEVSRAQIGSVPPPAPHAARTSGRMIDSHGRTIRDVRISITDRCNFRCVYCLDRGGAYEDDATHLTTGEIGRLARVLAGLGVRRIRLTGGEPTLHPQLGEIIAGVSAAGIGDIALTTNGSLLTPERLGAWHAAGLTRITVSLDSLDATSMHAITRVACTPRTVVAGIRMAIDAGLQPVKVNAVVIRGVNEDQVAPLAGLARRLDVEVRFIEFMPLDAGRRWARSSVVSAAEILAGVNAAYPILPLSRRDPSATAEEFEFADGGAGRIGVIAPVTRAFCGACSRLRITADGQVRTCLFSTREWDLLGVLRSGESDERVAEFLIDATWTKQPGHGIGEAGFVQPVRTMSAIGG